jgi:UDP-N-acetylglucosamine:LPS N-acetylglucosamine transferase
MFLNFLKPLYEKKGKTSFFIFHERKNIKNFFLSFKKILKTIETKSKLYIAYIEIQKFFEFLKPQIILKFFPFPPNFKFLLKH